MSENTDTPSSGKDAKCRNCGSDDELSDHGYCSDCQDSENPRSDYYPVTAWVKSKGGGL